MALSWTNALNAIKRKITARRNVTVQPHLANAGSKRAQFSALMMIAAAKVIATSAVIINTGQDIAGTPNYVI